MFTPARARAGWIWRWHTAGKFLKHTKDFEAQQRPLKSPILINTLIYMDLFAKTGCFQHLKSRSWCSWWHQCCWPVEIDRLLHFARRVSELFEHWNASEILPSPQLQSHVSAQPSLDQKKTHSFGCIHVLFCYVYLSPKVCPSFRKESFCDMSCTSNLLPRAKMQRNMKEIKGAFRCLVEKNLHRCSKVLTSDTNPQLSIYRIIPDWDPLFERKSNGIKQ